MTQTDASPSEMITFQPAIDIPNIDQAIASQRTGAATSAAGFRRSAVEMPSIEPAVQVASPSHHFCSTPKWKAPMAAVARAAIAPSQARPRTAGGIAWGPLLVLSLIEGTATGGRGALLDDAQVWVRCLFALPCLLLAESLVDDRIGQAMSSLLRSTLLGPAQRPAFEAARLRLQQGLDLWWVEATMIVIAVAGARSGVFAARVPTSRHGG